MRHLGVGVVLAVVASLTACSRRTPSGAGAEASTPTAEALLDRPQCFDVTTAQETPMARAVFTARKCQGGGVTWAGLARGLVAKRGALRPIQEPTPGWTGDVNTLSRGGQIVRVSFDEEGDAARICSDSRALLDDLRRDVARLRADRAELERALASADPEDVECFGRTRAD